MADKKISTHLIFTGVHFLLAIITLLPTGTASKNCLLGYNALCSFTPISTVMLLAAAGLHVYLHMKAQTAKTE